MQVASSDEPTGSGAERADQHPGAKQADQHPGATRADQHRVARQRQRWTRRAPGWDHGDMPGLEKVAKAVLDEAGSPAGKVVVDLGSGSGQLTLTLAREAAVVHAVDISPKMLELLQARAASDGITNISSLAVPLEELTLPSASVDVIVTNYALHHLRNPDKQRLLDKAAVWLRPGGRIVIGDMMFGRGSEARDRQIIASKVIAIGRKGPAGWWRLAKNVWRYLVRNEECPVSITTWESMLRTAGFTGVRSYSVVAEAAIATATAGKAAAG